MEASLTGFIDIHVHSSPSMFPRSVNDYELAQEAAAVGMRGFVLKAHEEPTVSRAILLKRTFPNLDVFGSLVLNWFVGGLNPYSVELALAMGAKIIWMPTSSAQQHIAHYGGVDYDVQKSKTTLRSQEGISIFDDAGKVRGEVYDILDMIASRNVVAASGHLSPLETQTFVDLAKTRGVSKILVAHPDLSVNQMPLELQTELVSKGAFVEKSYLTLMRGWQSTNIDELVQSIKVLGSERCILQTDFGQETFVSPPRGYLEFVTLLEQHGISRSSLVQMGAHNPADLLDLPRVSL